jgi:hypothetical protein
VGNEKVNPEGPLLEIEVEIDDDPENPFAV